MGSVSPLHPDHFVQTITNIYFACRFERPFRWGKPPNIRKRENLSLFIPKKLMRRTKTKKPIRPFNHRNCYCAFDDLPFLAVAVSLVTTGAGIGIQEEQGDAAFYIAEGD